MENQAELAAAPRKRRGRKPRKVITTANGGLAFESALDIQPGFCDGAAILRLFGRLETESVVALRDAAFTEIGARPPELCLDLYGITSPLERPAIETLVTIGRVARLVQVRYSVIVPPEMESVWRSAGLTRLISIQRDPRFVTDTMKPMPKLGVSLDGVS